MALHQDVSHYIEENCYNAALKEHSPKGYGFILEKGIHHEHP
jgi:hypothetical protein